MAGVDFSELYKQTSGLARWAPDGSLLAVAVGHRLVIRDAETMQVGAKATGPPPSAAAPAPLRAHLRTQLAFRAISHPPAPPARRSSTCSPAPTRWT